MPAVTQLTPNFLGGVSKQNDDKKLQGQVTECINGYPDPTYGLLKRPGMKFIDKLKDSGGSPFNQAALDGAIWFSLDRGTATSYVGAIKGTNVYVWTADGTWCTVTNTGTGYLTGTTANDYHFRSIQDTTIITNKTVTTAMQAAGSYVSNSVATLKLIQLVAGYEYEVNIQGESTTSSAQSTTTYSDMLTYDAGSINTNHHLVDDVVSLIQTQQAAANADFDGTWYVEGYADSLVIRRTNATPNAVKTDFSTPTGTPLTFTITGKGGLNNAALEVFQDQVGDVSKLTLESFNGHNVKIENSNIAEDDYYVKFVAEDGVRGRGSWQETLARNVSPDLDAATMPHELANTGATTFTFGPISWTARTAGDDVTNPQPSFIGYSVNATFFYNNRFGMLSEDNIIFGVANDSYNFFSRSALTQIDSDPIDLNVSSVRPVKLADVLPSPQGLTIFSERQQFQVFATDTSILTPSSTVVRTISNYEMDPNISPVDVGTSAIFVSKVPSYSKVFSIQLQDVETNPIVVDISKAVLQWIPDTVDNLIVSPQNSLVVLVDRGSSYMYLFRFYNNGEKNLFQAWTKWQLTGTIQSASILNNDIVVVTQHEDEYTLQSITIDEIPTGSVTATVSSTDGNSCLDFATRPVSPTGIPSTLGTIVGGTGYSNNNNVATTGGTGTGLTVDTTTSGGVITAVSINTAGTGYTTGDVVTISGGGGNATVTVASLTIPEVVYDSGDDVTKIYVSYTPISTQEATILIAKPSTDEGYSVKGRPKVESGTGYNYFEVDKDFTGLANGIVIGYGYDFEVTLPTFYFRRSETETDFTAVLTIARVRVSAGRTGALTFKTRVGSSKEWIEVKEVTTVNDYAATGNPVKAEYQFIVPIHQRNTNFELKVTSNFPYPVSLVSMMWEGNYSPRFYRRA